MKHENTFENVILRLARFWQSQGCLLFEPYNGEVGAGTFNPATFLRILDDKPWRIGYVELARRPRDGRYGANPNRLEQHHQYQVILKPAPANVQRLYLDSLAALDFKISEHEVRFVEDDWESPTLGAWGIGWEVWLDGMEITQFTYFQQAGGLDLPSTPVEITYGLERICMHMQGADSIFGLKWNEHLTYADVYLEHERQFSAYNFEHSDPAFLRRMFDEYEREGMRLFQSGLYLPGYDCAVKCSNLFNIMEARGSISTSERAKMIARVRNLSARAAELYLAAQNPTKPSDSGKTS